MGYTEHVDLTVAVGVVLREVHRGIRGCQGIDDHLARTPVRAGAAGVFSVVLGGLGQVKPAIDIHLQGQRPVGALVVEIAHASQRAVAVVAGRVHQVVEVARGKRGRRVGEIDE